MALFIVLPVVLFDSVLQPLVRGASGKLLEASVCIGTVGLGYFLPKHKEGERQVARWTWIIPLTALIILFWGESTNFGIVTAAKAFFMAEPAGDSEGLAAILFTFPTVSSIGYAIGAALSLASSPGKRNINK